MTLDLGELVGYLVVDDKRWNFDGALKSMDQFGDKAKVRAKNAGDQAGDAFGGSLVPEAQRAGEEAGEKAGDGLKVKGALGAAAAGAAVGMAFVEALDLDAAQDKLVAQLGASARQSERYGRVAGNLYANAWGDSMDQVNEAIASVVTSIDGMDSASGRQLGRLTSRALDFATAFDVDVARSVQVADTLIESGLAKNGIRAFDLLTKGAQKVPSALREDLQDAVEEYGQFFHGLGFSGPQAFALLVDASEKGIYGLDKAGDAVKEFTIRATDGSKATATAFDLADVKMSEIETSLLKGGDAAQDAFQKVVDGLLDIEDPAIRANAAIALFGTPLEDLNVNDIPEFLRNLQRGSDSMDGFRGSSKQMSDDLNTNARTSITEFTRTMKTDLVGYLEDKVIPVLEDDVIPAVRRFGDWFEKDGGPALRDFKDDLDPVIDRVGDLAGFLNDMPGEGKILALGSALAGGIVVKHKLSGIFDRGGIGNPMFVVVTNPTGGVPGVPGGAPGGKPGAPPVVPAGGKWLSWIRPLIYGGVAAGALGNDDLSRWRSPVPEGKNPEWDAYQDSGLSIEDWTAKQQKLQRDLADISPQVAAFQGALDLVGSTKMHPELAVPGMKDAKKGVREFIALQIEAGKPVYSSIFLTGIERAMGQLATLNAGIDAVGERGVDNGVPYLHGGTRGRQGGAGGTERRSPFDGANFLVQPPNYDAFMRDMDKRAQVAGLGGFG